VTNLAKGMAAAGEAKWAKSWKCLIEKTAFGL